MKTIPVHKAKSSLSQLIKLATEGENVLIGGYGKPQVMLTAITTKPKKRIGALRGKLIVPDDFDAPLPEDVLTSFNGK
jgi:antitoxin (DNA-binding transcriptional repressor) of toxin-antitoxin stability system